MLDAIDAAFANDAFSGAAVDLSPDVTYSDRGEAPTTVGPAGYFSLRTTQRDTATHRAAPRSALAVVPPALRGVVAVAALCELLECNHVPTAADAASDDATVVVPPPFVADVLWLTAVSDAPCPACNISARCAILGRSHAGTRALDVPDAGDLLLPAPRYGCWTLHCAAMGYPPAAALGPKDGNWVVRFCAFAMLLHRTGQDLDESRKAEWLRSTPHGTLGGLPPLGNWAAATALGLSDHTPGQLLGAAALGNAPAGVVSALLAHPLDTLSGHLARPASAPELRCVAAHATAYNAADVYEALVSRGLVSPLIEMCHPLIAASCAVAPAVVDRVLAHAARDDAEMKGCLLSRSVRMTALQAFAMFRLDAPTRQTPAAAAATRRAAVRKIWQRLCDAAALGEHPDRRARLGALLRVVLLRPMDVDQATDVAWLCDAGACPAPPLKAADELPWKSRDIGALLTTLVGAPDVDVEHPSRGRFTTLALALKHVHAWPAVLPLLQRGHTVPTAEASSDGGSSDASPPPAMVLVRDALRAALDRNEALPRHATFDAVEGLLQHSCLLDPSVVQLLIALTVAHGFTNEDSNTADDAGAEYDPYRDDAVVGERILPPDVEGLDDVSRIIRLAQQHSATADNPFTHEQDAHLVRKPLLFHCRTGAQVRLLVEHGADVAATDVQATSLLKHHLLKPDIVAALVDSGIDVPARPRPDEATRSSITDDVVAMFIETGVEAGGDVSYFTERNVRVLDALAEHVNVTAAGIGAPPLHRAVRHLEPGLVKKLLTLGADPMERDAAGRTPLLTLCGALTSAPRGARAVGVLRVLVAAGADVNTGGDTRRRSS